MECLRGFVILETLSMQMAFKCCTLLLFSAREGVTRPFVTNPRLPCGQAEEIMTPFDLSLHGACTQQQS
eukprot:6201768-Pleurochrysis_carterae.AAC.1